MPDEFESATENEALKRAITERIRAEGGISFRDFMGMALYHPGLGYYTGEREKIGRSGDYLTSPEVSPLFGAMLGRQLREMWERMERPVAFEVVEAGAGTGVLARDILAWAQRAAPEFAAALRYTVVEVSPRLTERQRERLDAEGLEATWRTDLPEEVSGVILSNELLDAMPVHRVAVRDGALREVYVTWNGRSFQEELREPSANVAAHFERVGVLPGEGCYAEANPAAAAWAERAARAIKRGFLLTLDYGYEAEELYAPWRTDGTLMCFHRHTAGSDPYVRIGRQDITSHVDFTSVRRATEGAGMLTLGLVSQSQFLANLGVGEALGNPGTDLEEHMARRRAVMELLDPGGLGRIKVLVQGKNVGEVWLTGLAEGG
jgi:SAM-dependent MidA family methyltransferase